MGACLSWCEVIGPPGGMSSRAAKAGSVLDGRCQHLLVAVSPGQQNDGKVQRFGPAPENPESLKLAQNRHHNVQYDQVGDLLLDESQSVFSVLGR